MVKNVLTNIGGVGAYGLISLCLFFAFFVGMLLWALRLKKSYLNAMRGLPLDGDSLPEPAIGARTAMSARSRANDAELADKAVRAPSASNPESRYE